MLYLNQKQPKSLLHSTPREKSKLNLFSLSIDLHSEYMSGFIEKEKKRGKLMMPFTTYFINTIACKKQFLYNAMQFSQTRLKNFWH